jgi:geranylgeranyl diphosphate synthase type II
MMDISSYIQSQKEKVDAALNLLIPEKDCPYATLLQAARYSLLSSGKRIRPVLTLATVESLGGNTQAALQPACALEMIHTYSLIHDDLPCMDNDDFRRGKPSLHRVFPEGHALLAGDFLLTRAFETISEAPDLSSEQRLELVSHLSKRAGGDGMIGGQTIDLLSEGMNIDKEGLQLMHGKKTGELILASFEFAAIIAKASRETKKILRDFGQNIGLAYQIVDDILDSAGSDKGSKSTYVSLMGMEEAKSEAENLMRSANEQLDKLPFETKILGELASLLIHRKS